MEALNPTITKMRRLQSIRMSLRRDVVVVVTATGALGFAKHCTGKSSAEEPDTPRPTMALVNFLYDTRLFPPPEALG